MSTEIAPTEQGRLAFTIKEAARTSGLSRSLLYVAIARGALHARKCGARTLILDSELRRFLRSLPPVGKGKAPGDARGKSELAA
jgi:excisionase family DNA binding protein